MELPRSLWQPTLFWRLGIGGKPIPDSYPFFFYAYLASFVFLALGLFSRTAAFANFLLSLVVLSYTNNFGCSYHSWNLLPILASVLMLSRTGDAYSLDARWFGTRLKKDSLEYVWPVWLIQFFILLMYFAAGLAKLQNWGPEFIREAGVLRSVALTESWFGRDYLLSGFTEVLRMSPFLASAMSLLAIGVELSAPLFLFSRRLKYPIALALVLLQTGIILQMQLYSFSAFALIYVFFIPFDSLKGFWANTVSMKKAGGSNSQTRTP